MSDRKYYECRVRLNYGSLVRLTVLLGFCAGLFAIPLLLLTSLGQTYGLLNLMAGAPVAGALTGLLLAVLGSPVYTWWTLRTDGQRFTGTFQVNHESALPEEGEPRHR